MSDRYIEKSFLYLLFASLLLHTAIFAVIALVPEKKTPMTQEPIMIDLEDVPELKNPSPTVKSEEPTRRQAERTVRVPQEMAPKGEMERDRIASLPRRTPVPLRPQLPASERRSESARPAESVRQGDIPLREAPPRETPRGEGILKPKSDRPVELAQLMPNAGKLAKLEETYRKKYSAEVQEGETKFLDTDDIQFGSFLSRFENAIYGVWRYPQDAARLGIEGVTPVKITFNSRGEIEKWEILQSSGSRILDGEVERTLRLIGPVGPFPKGYTKDKFHLIAFFQYGIVKGASRGTLH